MFLIINFVKEHNKNFYKTMFATLNLFFKASRIPKRENLICHF